MAERYRPSCEKVCVRAAAGSDCTQLMSLLLYCGVVDAAFTNCDITLTWKLLPLVSASHWLVLLQSLKDYIIVHYLYFNCYCSST